jgi:hypothetical protein
MTFHIPNHHLILLGAKKKVGVTKRLYICSGLEGLCSNTLIPYGVEKRAELDDEGKKQKSV